MGYVIKIETLQSGDQDEKSTLLVAEPGLSVNDQRAVVKRMTEIIKTRSKKENWKTGLNADKSIEEQYEDIIDVKLTRDEFNFFKKLVPKGQFGTDTIVSIVHAEVADWTNRLK